VQLQIAEVKVVCRAEGCVAKGVGLKVGGAEGEGGVAKGLKVGGTESWAMGGVKGCGKRLADDWC
jgi:hypothetical protein